MANPEIYKPVPSISVEGFTHSQVQEVTTPSKCTPFKDGHLPQFSIVAIDEKIRIRSEFLKLFPWPDVPGIPSPNDESEIKIGNEAKVDKLRQISDRHGRSYEYPIGEEGGIIFSDEFGNIYTSITTKGNNLTNPYARTSGVTPSGAEFYGLQDSDSMVRAIRASELLRSHGIQTELFIRVIEPLELPYRGRIITLNEFKKELIKAVWEENAPNDNKSGQLTREQIPSLVEVLNQMTFFITIRGMQTPERLNDILRARTREDIDRMMSRAFRYINLLQQKKIQEDPNFKPYTYKDLSDDKELASDAYFTLILPHLIAENLAKMHKLGLVHIFPHIGNVSTVGSIYDLDSVRGEPLGLGDEPVTKDDIIKDFMEFLYGHGDYYAPFELANLFRVQDGEYVFRAQLIQTYLEEMGWTGSLEHLEDIERICKEDFEQRPAIRDFYLQEIFKRHKIKFKYPVAPEEIAEFAIANIPVKGGKSSIKDGEHANSERQKQNIISAHVYLGRMQSELERHCQQKKFYKQATEEQRTKFLKWFHDNTLMKVNEAFAEIIGDTDPDDEANVARIKEEYNKKPKSEALGDYELQFYYHLISDWGWDENILEHIIQIDDLFGSWGSTADDPPSVDFYLEFYTDLIKQQADIDYVHTETVEELISLFQDFDTEHARELVEKALFSTESYGSREEIVTRTLETWDKENNWSDNPYSRFLGFTYDRIIDSIWEQVGDKLDRLEDKYGEETAITVAMMLCDKENARILREGITDEIYDNIVSVANKRIADLKSYYVSQAITSQAAS